MYDTHVTVVGNVLHEPEWRRTANTGALVTTFKIASTARRLDRETGKWMDGNSLRVRVNCWRALASNVKNSVTRGDPLIVTGRLFTRDWIDENGVKRTLYELEAAAVGHDLSRGRAVFERVKGNTATSTVEDAEAEQRVSGEPTEPVPDEQAPSQFDETSFDAALDRLAATAPPVPAPVPVPVGGGEADPDQPDGPAAGPGPEPAGSGDQPGELSGQLAGAPAGDPEPELGRRRGLRRAKAAA
jgi:single-strand DNA-binding protein